MNLTTAEDNIARLLCAAHRGGRKLTHDDLSGAAENLESAYRIQERVAEEIGIIGGFKTGRRSIDEDPIMAPIFEHRIRPSPARFVRPELDLIGIELEIGFRIDRQLPDPGSADFANRAWQCVYPLAAIEIVDTRLADHESATPFWKLADNQINAGLAYCEPGGSLGLSDLESVTASLDVGRHVIFEGPANVPGGNAFEIFCAFARQVGDHCGGLRPGQIVITGSVTGLQFIDAGQSVRGTIDGLGTVNVEFP